MLIDDTWNRVFLFPASPFTNSDGMTSSSLVEEQNQMLMPRNFIANDPSNIESSQSWLHIRGVVRPNDTERTMWWNWILILPIKSYWNCPKLLFMRRRRTSGVRTAQRRRKTTTQRREEGQMKSCVSNNVLPIPREIYFSGFAVSTPRFYFTQSPTEKRQSAASLATTKRPSTFQKTMGVKFLYVRCALFSHGFKGEKPQKSQF